MLQVAPVYGIVLKYLLKFIYFNEFWALPYLLIQLHFDIIVLRSDIVHQFVKVLDVQCRHLVQRQVLLQYDFSFPWVRGPIHDFEMLRSLQFDLNIK